MAKWPYNTAKWARLRQLKLSQAPLCEYCQPGQQRPATQVDHKKAIRDGGAPFDLNNLASSCQRCHSQKTANNERLKGCDPAGMPRDPGHAWNQGVGGEIFRVKTPKTAPQPSPVVSFSD